MKIVAAKGVKEYSGEPICSTTCKRYLLVVWLPRSAPHQILEEEKIVPSG
jgi:hypothetical protein